MSIPGMLGPDASRYVLAGRGVAVAKPFNLRVLLPWVCRDVHARWRAVWLASWPVAAAGLFWWGWAAGLSPARCAAVAVLCLALPGVWGPHVVRPIGVDLPALAVGVVAVAALEQGWWPLAVVLAAVGASIKESTPVWIALWAWNPVVLGALIVPAVVRLLNRPEIDPVTAQPTLREVHDRPVRTALAAHRMQWRNAYFMVAPWGATLAALYRPSWQTVAVLVVAYAQLLVATDTVRLLHSAAGPAVAFAAAKNIPEPWLLLACAVHVVWWRQPELV